MASDKTNVMRLLDGKRVPYTAHDYSHTSAISGAEVAEALGEDPDRVFKTLVTRGAGGEHYVFMIPVMCELDLRKAARAVGEKSVEMVKSKELLPLTGYIHGGCSPIGMKKRFTTVIDETAGLFDRIFFSAGKIGWQVETTLDGLGELVEFTLADITE